MFFYSLFGLGLFSSTLARFFFSQKINCADYTSPENIFPSKFAISGNATKTLAPFSYRFALYQLGDVIPLSHDAALFRFLLPNPEMIFDLNPCSTLQACYKYGVQPAEQCVRFYTPITPNGTKGYFDLVVRRKKDGKMTNHLFGMNIGDKLLFRALDFKIKYSPNRWEHVGMIAGGTGFTPMLQIIRQALSENKDVQDNTNLYFLYCNRTEKHILLKGVFDNYAKKYKNRFKLKYLVDRATDKDNWNGWTGFVKEEHIRESMPSPSSKKYIIMICGPDKLLNHVAGTPMHSMLCLSSGRNIQPVAGDANNLVNLGGILGNMGYDNNCVYRF